MSEPFIGEIRIFAGNFPIRTWAFCNGMLLPIAQNTALFSILGTTYGGNGETNFALPDLQGRAPLHPGTGPGLTNRRLGEKGGAPTATLTGNPPLHSHQLHGAEGDATTSNPSGSLLAATPENAYDSKGNPTPMAADAITTTSGQPHNNMQPYLALNFIIALQGLFPTRS